MLPLVTAIVVDVLWLLSAEGAAETTVVLVELLLAESSNIVSEPGRRGMGTRVSCASPNTIGDGFDGEVDV